MFKDPWNPTQEEIKQFAYAKGPLIEIQDFELAINDPENIPLICSLVNDPKCCHHSLLLSSLYVYTGDIVKSKDRTHIDACIQLLHDLTNLEKNTILVLDWIIRSIHLILFPETYTYDCWGIGSRYAYGTSGLKVSI